MTIEEIHKEISKYYEFKDGIYFDKNSNGYWSNLSKEDQKNFLSIAKESGDATFKKVISKSYPKYSNYIFSEQRTKGLELLDILPDEIGADFGCMWGNILTYIAKNCKLAVGFDKTFDHLIFLKERIKKENLNNIVLINKNLQEDLGVSNIFDFAIVNGVLEWIPLKEDIEVDNDKRQSSTIKISESPTEIQVRFLKNVFTSLKQNGRLYLAIENRWDYQYFLWKKDPHTQLFYTAFLTRKISNFISKILKGKPYLNYLYSVNQLKKILGEIGFSEIIPYGVFPGYRYPNVIVPVFSTEKVELKNIYKPLRRKNIFKIIFHKTRRLLDLIVYEKLKLYHLSPSWIFIARK